MTFQVLLLDLVDDPLMIAEYEAWHREVWPEVLAHLRDIGVRRCDIYRAGNRLVMLMESASIVATDGGGGPVPEKVAEWEALMDKFQQRLPFAEPGQKWVPAKNVFAWSAEHQR